MSIYKLYINSIITIENLKQGLYIFVYRASKTPPHIGMIVNGKLYDINSVGPNIDLSVDDFYTTIINRKTEVIFIELAFNNRVDLNQLITQKVNKYWKVSSNTSCLTPIKDFINEVYNIEVNKSKFIFELLPLLYDKNLVKGVSQLNLSDKISSGVFKLIKYTEKDIEKCIEALNRKDKIVC